jgi:hypothetical protein
VNCLYERVRSGVIHMGFGTIISSMAEREAARMGHLVGHWHLHLYFPTYMTEREGDNEPLIEDGRLKALDDPKIRAMCREVRRSPTCGWTRAGTRRSPAST